MPVPYLFSSVPGGTTIPLSELDANFQYCLDNADLTNANIAGNATVGGMLTANGGLTINGAITVDGSTVNPVGTTGTGALVFNTSPTLVTPILGTPTSGNLSNCTGYPVSQVVGLATGVLPFLSNPSSANLAAAVVDETGTGNLVFSNNPTLTFANLVSPILGTPTSGNLSLCTGYPAPSLAGVVQVANGGTGMSTTGSVGDVLTVTAPGVIGYTPAPPSSSIAGGAASQILYQSSPSVTSFIPNGTSGQFLLSQGSAPPIWGGITLTSNPNVTGTLPIANGGTGLATTGAVGEVLIVTGANTLGYASSPPSANVSGGAASQILYQSAPNTTAFIPNGLTGNVLLSNGAAAPSWGALNISTSNVTGLLPITNGGTGAANAVNALNNLLPSQSGNANKVLTTDGSGNITWTNNTYSAPNVNTSLRAIPAVANQIITVAGYYSAGDGGGGLFYGVTGGSYTDNGGTIITTGLGVTAGSAWLRIYTGALSVKFFGAYGNGTNDDTAAIQATVNAAVGSSVYIPTGTYVTGSINLPPATCIFGDSPIASILQPNANNISVLSMINNVSALQNGPNIVNIGFSLPAGTPYSNVTAINLTGASSANRINFTAISNVDVFANGPNIFSNGIYMTYCVNTHIINSRITWANNGLFINNCADTDLVNIDIQLGNNIGFTFQGGGPGAFDEGIRMTNCTTNGQQVGCYIFGQSWGEMNSCSLTTAPGGAFILENANNWNVSGCEFSSANSGGPVTAANVNIFNNSTNICISSSFLAIGTFGISVSNSVFVNVNACRFANNSNVDIFLGSSSQVSVVANICESAGSAISIDEAGASDYNIITNNIVQGTVVQVGANSLVNNNVTY